MTKFKSKHADAMSHNIKLVLMKLIWKNCNSRLLVIYSIQTTFMGSLRQVKSIHSLKCVLLTPVPCNWGP